MREQQGRKRKVEGMNASAFKEQIYWIPLIP